MFQAKESWKLKMKLKMKLKKSFSSCPENRSSKREIVSWTDTRVEGCVRVAWFSHRAGRVRSTWRRTRLPPLELVISDGRKQRGWPEATHGDVTRGAGSFMSARSLVDVQRSTTVDYSCRLVSSFDIIFAVGSSANDKLTLFLLIFLTTGRYSEMY